MNRPKSKPRNQITNPKMSSLCPLTPRKETFERSGNFKFASPPASCVSATAADALKNRSPAAVVILTETFRRESNPCDQALLSQVSIYDPPEFLLGTQACWPHSHPHLLPAICEIRHFSCGAGSLAGYFLWLPVCDGTRDVLRRFQDPCPEPHSDSAGSLHKPN